MVFNFFRKKKEEEDLIMKKAPNNKCPKCGHESVYIIEGLDDISLWCIDCGWRQVDYSANKPSIFS